MDASLPHRPLDWAAVATPAQWRLAVRALGSDVDELLPVLRTVSPAFRRRFFDELATLQRAHPHPRAVALALARALHAVGEAPG